MWGRRPKGHRAGGVQAADPVVLAVTSPLTGNLAGALVRQVERLCADTRVVVDLTAIPGFDSDGASMIAELLDRLGSDQVTIVGFRQAAARLTGAADVSRSRTNQAGWVVHRMHNLAVVQPEENVAASTDDIDAPVSAALEDAVAIVVVDLRGVTLTARGTETLAFASSGAAVRGQELLVVNVDAEGAEQLRLAGLSATTYVAPET